MKTYSELKNFSTFEERFNYLKLSGIVGEETFGYERYLNQFLYRSQKWKSVREKIIIRDFGCDLGIRGHDICGIIIVHHMNPITVEQIESNSEIIFDPEFLISTSLQTHNGLHYGYKDYLMGITIAERTPGDTCPWKH